MNKAVHIADKLTLWSQIKRLGAFYGEATPFTAEYAKDVYAAYTGDLATAIQCFKDLIAQAEKLPRRVRDGGKIKTDQAVQ
jgi:hypothetical protein